MDKIKVIVADDNSIVREILVDAICDEEDIEIVATATNGKETIESIKKYKPDVVLLDLIMPLVDGMGVMETIREDAEFAVRPYFVIISAAGKDTIISQALEVGASYFFMKPFDEAALIKRIRQLCTGERAVVHMEPSSAGGENSQLSIENSVTSLMKKLCVPLKMVGYKYLREAIIIAINEPDALMSVTKNIYPQVAYKFDTSSGNVERNIRYVIESSWSKIGDKEDKTEFFQILGETERKLTNSEFILQCSEWIKYNS